MAAEGPATKKVLAAMGRGLRERTGRGTWDATLHALEDTGRMAVHEHRLGRDSGEVLSPDERNRVLETLRRAAASDDPLDPGPPSS